jgi:hypothetical protein
MRNLLSVAVLARIRGVEYFLAVVICPRSTSTVVRAQVESFQQHVLREEYRDRLVLRTYESYIEALRSTGDADAQDLAEFLNGHTVALG